VGATAGEDHLVAMGVDECRDLIARPLDRRPGTLPLTVGARGVGVQRAEHGRHGLGHFRPDRCRCVVVEIDHGRPWCADVESGGDAAERYCCTNFCSTSMLSCALTASGDPGASSTTFFHIRMASR